MPAPVPPTRFYTGLVAELYEALAADPGRAEDCIPFLARSGTPALELACGSGLPLLDLVARGYDVEGLDSSPDMLARCRARARARGLAVSLHHAEMQSFSLARRYRSIFLAGASFTLLTGDADARAALARILAHLEPGGAASIPVEIPDVERLRESVGRFRETATDAGERLRVGVVALDVSADGRALCRRLRYERIPARGAPQVLERDWLTRWWPPEQLREMLLAAGFERVALREEGRVPAGAAAAFVAEADRGAGAGP